VVFHNSFRYISLVLYICEFTYRFNIKECLMFLLVWIQTLDVMLVVRRSIVEMWEGKDSRHTYKQTES